MGEEGHSGPGLQTHSWCMSETALDFGSGSLVLTLFWRKSVAVSVTLHLITKYTGSSNTSKLPWVQWIQRTLLTHREYLCMTLCDMYVHVYIHACTY